MPTIMGFTRTAGYLLVALASGAAPLRAQGPSTGEAADRAAGALAPAPEGVAAPSPFALRSAPADSVSARIMAEAGRAPGTRIVISLSDRTLWLMKGSEILYSAAAGVGKPFVMEYEGKTWDFSTPRGRRSIRSKVADPIWVPPDWHFVELAAQEGFQLRYLDRSTPVTLQDGSRLLVRNNQVGRLGADGQFRPIPVGEEIVYDNVLFVPPLETVNRHIPGELGRYELSLGDGYYLHGTPVESTVGTAATHGCIRLLDADLEYLYRHVPVGTPVFIY